MNIPQVQKCNLLRREGSWSQFQDDGSYKRQNEVNKIKCKFGFD